MNSTPVLPDEGLLPWLEFDRLPFAYLVCDMDLRLKVWNREAERTFGYAREEVLGTNALTKILPEPIDEAVYHTLARLRAGDMDAHSVAENKTRDGRRIFCEWFNTPMRDSSGEITHLVCLARDITKRVEAERAVEQHAARLQNLSRRLVEVQETERRHLARELHDQFGQVLTGLLTLLTTNDAALPEPARVRCTVAQGLVRELLDRVRQLSFDLRPAALDQLGLIPALLSLIERFTQQTAVQVDFKHQGMDGRFPNELETAAFRIIQEALTNVARHAQVAHATVRVWATHEILGVRVEDRGRGFDPNSALFSAKSSGLTGMQERAKLLGSQVTIESREGGGTVITAELPLIPNKVPVE